MSDVKWIKIVNDIFDDEKILLIESMPDADSLIVIWFKLLCFAGKQNNNGVFLLNDRIAYTDEMLSTIFRRPINTVRLALSIFKEYGMIEIIDGVITIPNWQKHQNIDSLDKIREQNRLRKQAQRDRQRLLADGVTDMSRDSHVTVTQQNKKENKKENKKKSKEEKAPLLTLEELKTKFSDSVSTIVLEWLTYKHEKNEDYVPTGLKSLLTQIANKITKYGEQPVIDLIQLSMANGWKGIIWDKLKQNFEKNTSEKATYDPDKYSGGGPQSL